MRRRCGDGGRDGSGKEAGRASSCWAQSRSILALRTQLPSGRSPARISRNRARFSSTVRSRYGDGRPGSTETAPIVLDLLVAQMVDVRLPLTDELLGQLVHLVEIIGRVQGSVPKGKAEPVDVRHDGVDVLDAFGERVGVIEAKVAMAAILLGHAEVEADRLGVTDVQIAVRLRRKAGDDAAVMLARAQVVLDDLADEIRAARPARSSAITTSHSTGERRRPFSGGPIVMEVTPPASADEITPPPLVRFGRLTLNLLLDRPDHEEHWDSVPPVVSPRAAGFGSADGLDFKRRLLRATAQSSRTYVRRGTSIFKPCFSTLSSTRVVAK